MPTGNKAVVLRAKKSPEILVNELRSLLNILGYVIVDEVLVRGNGARVSLSKAKLEELAEKLKASSADTVIVEPKLPPHDMLEIMRTTGARVLDRTLVLLEVFDRHAGSLEAKLQIELARLKHSLPLIREALNRSKRGELPGFMAGGRYAVDWYYRHVRKKIAVIRRKLEDARKRRRITRVNRKKVCGLPMVALTGFSNAGKTTLFNAITGCNKPTGPQLFTTLHPKVAIESDSKKFMVVDTVGFVMNVPPEIIEAFYSTLEEITESDLIVLVIDSTEEQELIKYRIVEAAETLSKINAVHKPIIVAANKMDLVNQKQRDGIVRFIEEHARNALPGFRGAIPTSAIIRAEVGKMVRYICRILSQKYTFSESGTVLREIRE